jgi:predicted nucleic acid-binding protein
VIEVVVDASVVVKWVLPDRQGEGHARRALDVLRAVQAGQLAVVEPPHWLAEVAAVVARHAPRDAAEIMGLLHAMELPILDDLAVYREAVRLSAETGQHVFDTLYHAVALCRPNSSLVTADEQYYRHARDRGGVLLLRDFPIPEA